MSKLDRPAAWAITIATVLALCLGYVDRQTLSVLAPTVTAALHIGDAAYGWLSAAFSVAYLLCGPIAGALVDRMGARRSLPAALVLWSIVAALQAVAPAFGVLLVLRVLLGATESPSFPSGVQVVRRVLPADAQPRGMALLFVGMSVGAALAAPLAIGLATRTSWRWAFVGTAALAAAWVPVWMVLTRSPAARAALDDARASTATATPTPGRLEALRHPALLRGLVGYLAVGPTTAFIQAWEAKFYVARTGLVQRDLAPYLLASALLYDLGAIVMGDIAARRERATGGRTNHRTLFALGLAFAIAGMLLLAVARAPALALFALGLGAVARGTIVPLAVSDALARMPRRIVGAAGGVVASSYALAAIVVNPIVGTAVQHDGYVVVVVGLAAWTLLPGLVWLVWQPPPRVNDA